MFGSSESSKGPDLGNHGDFKGILKVKLSTRLPPTRSLKSDHAARASPHLDCCIHGRYSRFTKTDFSGVATKDSLRRLPLCHGRARVFTRLSAYHCSPHQYARSWIIHLMKVHEWLEMYVIILLCLSARVSCGFPPLKSSSLPYAPTDHGCRSPFL